MKTEKEKHNKMHFMLIQTHTIRMQNHTLHNIIFINRLLSNKIY